MTHDVKAGKKEAALEKTARVVRPSIHDRIELRRTRWGVHPRGTVHYVDDLQILIKWDDGRSESLPSALADRIRILPDDDPDSWHRES